MPIIEDEKELELVPWKSSHGNHSPTHTSTHKLFPELPSLISKLKPRLCCTNPGRPRPHLTPSTQVFNAFAGRRCGTPQWLSGVSFASWMHPSQVPIYPSTSSLTSLAPLKLRLDEIIASPFCRIQTSACNQSACLARVQHKPRVSLHTNTWKFWANEHSEASNRHVSMKVENTSWFEEKACRKTWHLKNVKHVIDILLLEFVYIHI